MADGEHEVLSRALGESLRPLADQHPGLVHQPPALVGASDSGVVSQDALDRNAMSISRAYLNGLRENWDRRTPTSSTPGSVLALAVCDDGLAGEDATRLKKFYPTTDLVTAPDIIFFWVARMIMAGYEFMGEMPFRNVYFTGIIRDKQGRKMSKVARQFARPARSHRQIRRRRAPLRHHAHRAARPGHAVRRASTSSWAATSATSSGTPAASARCKAAKRRVRLDPASSDER